MTAAVFGTFNRLSLLQRAVTSLRAASTDCRAIVIDGGSTDGTIEWLRAQPDVDLIQQTGPLTGAVIAFNLGFARAVADGHAYVAHLNDDAEIMTPGAIDQAIEMMQNDGKIGEVAFAFDLWGEYHFDQVNHVPYANFGVVRTTAGIQVAKAQGDPEGLKWWSPIYRTYGADSEFGAWLWKLGWRVHCADHLKVHDLRADDALRANNTGARSEADSKLFWERWGKENLEQYLEKNK